MARHINFLLPKPRRYGTRSYVKPFADRLGGPHIGTTRVHRLVVVGTLWAARGLGALPFRAVKRALESLAVRVNAVPIIVLVSVFNNMFAITSSVPADSW